MKKYLKSFVTCFVLLAVLCSCVLLGVGADGNDLEIFVESCTVNAESKVIELPKAYVYDTEDIGVQTVATVEKDGNTYAVTNGTFVADTLGDYNVKYTAINSRGDKAEKSITVTVIDTLAPKISTYATTLKFKINKEYSLPEFIVSDFYDVEQTVNVIANGEKTPLSEKFTFTSVQNLVIEIVLTEKRDNGLSTTLTYNTKVVNQGAIYGFDDLGTTGAARWTCAQSAMNTNPELYQVPNLTTNEDATYVHDIDGKSFKVEIKGKQGMSNSNSWPRVDTADISLPNLMEYEYLVAWIYNASPDYEFITVHGQLNGSNSFDTAVSCKRGEWTQIKMPISNLKSEYGSSKVSKIGFWVSGFETGTILYYLDDMYLI